MSVQNILPLNMLYYNLYFCIIIEDELKQMKIQLSSAQTRIEKLEALVPKRGNGIWYILWDNVKGSAVTKLMYLRDNNIWFVWAYTYVHFCSGVLIEEWLYIH